MVYSPLTGELHLELNEEERHDAYKSSPLLAALYWAFRPLQTDVGKIVHHPAQFIHFVPTPATAAVPALRGAAERHAVAFVFQPLRLQTTIRKEHVPMQKPLDDAYYRLLCELQTADFVLVELSLFLDTHPQDMEALRQFNQFAQKRQQLAAQYELQYGPLLQFGHSFSRYPFQWVETPWPWQV
jgi:spore coat protein JB